MHFGFRRTSSAPDVALDWTILLVALYFASRSEGILVPLVLAFVVARQLHALAVLFHEASHGKLHPKPFWNDLLSDLFCGGPLFFSLPAYRPLHLRHHELLMTEADPDLLLYKSYPVALSKFVRKRLANDLFGKSIFKVLRYFNGSGPGQHLVSGAVWNLAVFAYFVWVGRPALYLVDWIFPYVSLLPLLLRMRAVAEHGGKFENGAVPTRSIRSLAYRLSLGPHHIGYHFEHHLHPSVPHYRLPELHRHLLRRGRLPEANRFESLAFFQGDIFGTGPALPERKRPRLRAPRRASTKKAESKARSV